MSERIDKDLEFYERRSRERRLLWEEKQKEQKKIQRLVLFGGVGCIIVLGIVIVSLLVKHNTKKNEPVAAGLEQLQVSIADAEIMQAEDALNQLSELENGLSTDSTEAGETAQVESGTLDESGKTGNTISSQTDGSNDSHQNQVDQSPTEQGSTDQSPSNQGVSDQSPSEQGSTDQSPSNQGASDQSPSNQGASDQIPSEQDSADQSTDTGNPLPLNGKNDSINPADYVYDTSNAIYMGSEEMTSEYGLLVDVDQKKVVAQKDAGSIITPASMTKIMTILVAADYVTNLNDTYTIDLSITDYAFRNDCSIVGFSDGEIVTIKDLFYGTILPSGADAALALAKYVAGSQEAFVDLMNQKLQAMGLSDTAHFTNCVGLYDENHYCSLYDLAAIMQEVMNNSFLREVMDARTYTTSKTDQHPDGILVSNWFLRRIEDKDCQGRVIGAKTGYVVQSANCAVSYLAGNNGTNYVCVTAGAHSAWRCIYDHVAVYNIYAANIIDYKKG